MQSSSEVDGSALMAPGGPTPDTLVFPCHPFDSSKIIHTHSQTHGSERDFPYPLSLE